MDNLGYDSYFSDAIGDSGETTIIYVWNMPEFPNCFFYTSASFIEDRRNEGLTKIKLSVMVLGDTSYFKHHGERWFPIEGEKQSLIDSFLKCRSDYEAEQALLMED